jgi:hypothetical protein
MKYTPVLVSFAWQDIGLYLSLQILHIIAYNNTICQRTLTMQTDGCVIWKGEFIEGE